MKKPKKNYSKLVEENDLEEWTENDRKLITRNWRNWEALRSFVTKLRSGARATDSRRLQLLSWHSNERGKDIVAVNQLSVRVVSLFTQIRLFSRSLEWPDGRAFGFRADAKGEIENVRNTKLNSIKASN